MKCFAAFTIAVPIVLHRTCCCVVNIPGTCATPPLPPPQIRCRTWPRASWTPSPPCSSKAGSSCPSPPHCSSPSSPSCGTSRFTSREMQTQGIPGALSSVPYRIDKLNIHYNYLGTVLKGIVINLAVDLTKFAFTWFATVVFISEFNCTNKV